MHFVLIGPGQRPGGSGLAGVVAVVLLLAVGVLQAQPREVPPPPRLADLPTRSGFTVVETVVPERSDATARPGGDRSAALCVPMAAPSAAPADAGTAASDRAAAPARTAGPDTPEPAVQCSRFDTEAGRIEELRVRGQLQRVRVQPAGNARAYEIQLLDAGRDPSAKTGPGRGGEGQRVWPVLAF